MTYDPTIKHFKMVYIGSTGFGKFCPTLGKLGNFVKSLVFINITFSLTEISTNEYTMIISEFVMLFDLSNSKSNFFKKIIFSLME